MALIRRCVPFLTKSIKYIPVTTQAQKIHRWVAPTLMELKRRENKQGGKIAFTDRSYVIKEELKQKEMEFDIKMKDNRELAEEGEKFMKEYIQLYLEALLPKFPLEGVAGIRQHLMSEATLAHIAQYLGTKDIILAAEYPVESQVLAQALKAIVGALLRSSGDERAAHFVRDFVITQLNGQDVNEFWHIEDPWATLTGILAKEGVEVEPRLIAEVGRNTLLACYRVGLYIDKQMISAGFGESVPIAKEMAAREALKKIFGTEDHMKPINFQLQGMPKPAQQQRYQVAAS
ncbi:hypothetical protein NE865_05355 [Phthorimaea operculella]|nr:hypothetical protein NE865_05355 [Phthorimaea operculella]